MKASRTILYLLPSVLWALIIYALSSNAPLEENPFDWMDLIAIDKVGHFVFYCILCIALLWGISKIFANSNLTRKQSSWIAISIAFVYGAIMEVLQYYFYEGRQLDFLDMLANGVGAAVGSLIFHKLIFKN